jgi:hypothetical protein
MEPFVIHARVSFPHILQPHAATPSSPLKYSADLLLPVGSPDQQKVEAAAQQCAVEAFKENAMSLLAVAQNDRMLRSYGPGESKVSTKTGQPLVGYPGMFYVSVSALLQPSLVKPNGDAVDPNNALEMNQVAGQIYGGCWVNALIKPWAQNNQHGRTIRWDFLAVQFAKDDEPFGEGAVPVDTRQYFGAVAQATPAMPGAAGMAAPVPAAPVPAAPPIPPFTQPPAAPQQGPDGVWRDPVTGQPVHPPQMPGYPQ